MNLSLVHTRKGVSVAQPFTRNGKPRCQMEVSNDGWWLKQCERPASFFEPHHQPIHKGTVPSKTYKSRSKQQQLYSDDILFGYCKQHSYTEAMKRWKAYERERLHIAKAQKERQLKTQERQDMFKAMIASLEERKLAEAFWYYTKLRETGLRKEEIYLRV